MVTCCWKWLVVAMFVVHSGSVSGVPMVANSVKFALDRCRQFLHLATFLKPEALQENDEIGRTKRVCDHIVMIEDDFHADEVEMSDLRVGNETSVKQQPEDKASDENFGGCSVKVYSKQHFQGDAVTIYKSVKDTMNLSIRSLRIIGHCSWRFYDEPRYKGDSFTVDGKRGAAEHRDLDLASPSTWGWNVGRIRSVKKLKRSKTVGKNEF